MEFVVDRKSLNALLACEKLRDRFLQRYPGGARLTLALVREYNHAESSAWVVDRLARDTKCYAACHQFARDLAVHLLGVLPDEQFPGGTKRHIGDGLALTRGAEERRPSVDVALGLADACNRVAWRWARDAGEPHYSIGDLFYDATLADYAGVQDPATNTYVVESIWDWLELPRE